MIKNIRLNNFRNHKDISIQLNEGINFIIGENGTGKTSVLEGISLFFHTSGIRLADPSHLQNIYNTNIPWSIELDIEYISEMLKFKLFNKKITLNNEKIFKKDLKNYFYSIWIDPNILSNFDQTQTIRRKFIDNIISSYDINHNKRLARKSYFLKKRIEALNLNNISNDLLNSIEINIAQCIISIINARELCINKISKYLSCVRLDITKNELSIDQIHDIFINNRNIDRCSSRAKSHVDSDINIYYNNMSSDMCSTGQKSIVILDLIRSWGDLIFEYSDIWPSVLIDDFFSHIDKNGIDNIINTFQSCKMQFICTSVKKIDSNIGSLKNINYINF